MAGLLPISNPFAQWVDPRRNALMGFSAGMLSGDPGAAMRYAMQGAGVDQKRVSDMQAQAQAEQERNATAEWIKANAPQFATLPPALGFEAAMKQLAQARSAPGDGLMSVGGHIYDPATQQWISPPETAENRQNVSLTPQWGVGPDGKPVLLQTSSTGEMVQATMPEGVSLVAPFDLKAQQAAGTAFGKETGGAQFDVPAAEIATQQTLDAIQAIRAEKKGMDEQFGNILGVPQQMTPAFPGSDKAKFQVAVDRGTNLAFMQAREMLRGGGQITDFESKKAETAITNMQLAMEKGDKAQFEAALTTFEQAVKDGLTKLKTQAGTMPGYGAGVTPAGGSDLKTKYGLE